MLRVVAHQSAAAAQQYYAEGLKREDYYSEGQEVAGKWHGKAAAMLGLAGDVTPDAFAALVENRHPGTGERLTARTKANRRVGYDLNFHAPKSLSILHALTGDKDILTAFRSAVAETMGEIEFQTGARVRGRGANANRVTGNLAWAEFIHFTARPIGGIPDPHLHVHCFAFNATHDAVEGRWKAAEFHDIKKDAPYSEAVFHSLLTAKLSALGYGIERTKFGWEINGIPRTVIDRFSRRTAQIERLAAEKGVTDAKAKDALGAATREGKRRGLTHADLLAAWETRLTPAEKVLISKARFDSGAVKPAKITAAEAFDYASEKLFAKNSVVPQKRLLAEMMRYGVGQLTPEAVWREFGRRRMVVREVRGEQLCTSLSILGEEVSLIKFVRTGRDMFSPFTGKGVVSAKLSAEQKAAARHVLTSRDQVIAVRGAAGVGKTTLMKETVAAIEATGVRVFAFAPSAVASRQTLREAGFADAETVAHLLTNKKLQASTRGQVIWIDEAGLLGVREMWEIMRIAGNSTRVILTGDSRQHAPVARGDAFRLLERFAGLKIAEVTQIWRQERAGYKKAVEALSKGDLRTAFRRLDEIGAIIEVRNDQERFQRLAGDYIALSRGGSPPLVVSPTHDESAKVTAAIRQEKRDAGQLKGGKVFTRYHNLQWEEADRKRGENYTEGLVVQFHQNAKGIRRGALFNILGQDARGGVRAVGPDGGEIILPLQSASRFQVFEKREIELARGDRIRVTRNGETADGRRINNGDLFTIDKFRRNGQIALTNGAVLNPEHGHFTYGYCQTSHSSQSKSVRDVLVAQSESSFVASSREQFYVSVSRGKESVRIYTDNRRGLQEAVGDSSARRAGIELAGISGADISSFMSGGLNGDQWRDRIATRRVEGKATAHVANLLKERRQDVHAKQGGMQWKQYIDMRRNLTGASGRHRSKGYSTAQGGKGKSIQNRGRSFIRPTSLSTTTREKMLSASAAKKAGPVENKAAQKKPSQNGTRKDRAAKMYQSAAENLKKIGARIKQAAPGGMGKKLPQSNLDQVAGHRVRQKAADARKAAQKQVKVKQPTPAPRKGK